MIRLGKTAYICRIEPKMRPTVIRTNVLKVTGSRVVVDDLYSNTFYLSHGRLIGKDMRGSIYTNRLFSTAGEAYDFIRRSNDMRTTA